MTAPSVFAGPAPAAAEPAGAEPAEPRPATEPFPLTDLQAGYLVGSSGLIELGGFRPTMYLEFDLVDFDPRRARAAVDALIRRHEHLRTAVLAEGAQRALAPSEVEPFELRVVDLVGVEPSRQQRVLLEARRRMCDEGVEPTGWPLFDIVAHRVRPHRYRVGFAMSLLLLDSHSTRQLQQEWWSLYLDPAADLPPVQRTFRECLLERVEDEKGPDYRAHWAYWERRLDTLPEAPTLPVTGNLTSLEPGRLVRRTHHLDRERWRQLSAAFRAHRVLPNAALLHVYAETLATWAATPHFCLNVLHQNWSTSHPETAGVVGQFSSTLPLEVDLRPEGDFWARAERLQRQLWQDMAHSDVTAVQVTRELAARRGWSTRAALPYVFNSMLGPTSATAAALRRPACRTVYSNLRTPQVLIDNQLVDSPDGGVDCVWDVLDDAFPPGLADAMFDSYRQMVDTLATPEGARSQPIPVSAQHLALIERDNTDTSAPPRGRLEDGFLRRAARRPDAPAVITSARRLTYQELETASRAVARWLREHGVGAGDVVPVVMSKGWEQVVAVLGVLRAGAAYCPVDAALPAERIRHLLEDCSARVALDQAHRDPLRELDHECAVLHVDEQDPEIAADDGIEAPGASPGDLAYIIYTSGSTGQPKGVMIEHAAALNTIDDINRRIGLGEPDRVFGISSLSFDLSVWDVFGTLAAGAALVLPDASSRPDPVGWAEAAATHRVTVWNSVPALAEMLAEVAAQHPRDERAPVRCFLLSGDWVPTALPDRMRGIWPGTRVVALGGATEAAIWSNVYEVGHVEPQWRSIPYGRPLPRQTMRVLDHRLDVRAPWAVGRIHIGGAGLARGYWRDPERTAERFIVHPRTAERLYWTGDLGRYWPDGTIEFLGREDRQAKIQGFRVEPGEVEAVVRTCPGVRDCLVAVDDGPAGQKRLVALAVPHGSARLSPERIAEHLRARLPHYMVPGLIRTVPRLELSANGKVDVARSLAAATSVAPTRGSAFAGAGQTAARGLEGDTIARVAALWRELLEVDAIGPDADFFALGGNSLLALRLVNRVHTELGAELGFGEIFEARTARALAERIDGRGHAEPEGESAAGARRANSVVLSSEPGTELYLFHPVGGSVSCYTELARLWEGPVRAFQSRALTETTGRAPDGDESRDFLAMAAEYREELQRLSPRGPYLLGGWSMGGVLAYEVGRQLAEAGHEARVFMIDSDIHTLRVPETDVQGHLEFLADLADGTVAEAVRAQLTAAPPDDLERLAHAAAVAHGLLPDEVDVAGYLRLMRVHRDNLAALAGYRPAPSETPALLICAGRVQRQDPAPTWQALCKRLEVDVWPEDHYSIMAPTCQRSVAERVGAWLWRPEA